MRFKKNPFVSSPIVNKLLEAGFESSSFRNLYNVLTLYETAFSLKPSLLDFPFLQVSHVSLPAHVPP